MWEEIAERSIPTHSCAHFWKQELLYHHKGKTAERNIVDTFAHTSETTNFISKWGKNGILFFNFDIKKLDDYIYLVKNWLYLFTWNWLPIPYFLHHFFSIIYNLLKATELQIQKAKEIYEHQANRYEKKRSNSSSPKRCLVNILTDQEQRKKQREYEYKDQRLTFWSSENDFHWQCRCDWPFHFIKNSISLQSGTESKKWLNNIGSVDLLFLLASSAVPIGWCHNTFSIESPSSSSISSFWKNKITISMELYFELMNCKRP